MTIKDAPLVLAASLQLPDKTSIQSIDRDINGQWYVTQAIKGTVGDAETTRLHRLAIDGALISSMTLVNAGHGTSHYVRRDSKGVLRVGLNINTYTGGTRSAMDCVEFPYEDGFTYTEIVPPMTVVGKKQTPGYSMPLLNRENGNVVIRRTGHGEETYMQYSLNSYLTNIDARQVGKTIGPIKNGTGTPLHQGAAAWGNMLYRLVGNPSGTNKRQLQAWNLDTGMGMWVKDLSTLGGTGHHREPEGLFFDANGVLYVGCTTKDSKGAYVHLVYTLDPNDATNPKNNVWKAWPTTIAKYEGRCSWMYADTKNLVTTGTGNMIDTGKGLTLWGRELGWKDGKTYASDAKVAAEYTKVKHLGIQKQGGYVYEKHTSLRLDAAVIDWAVRSKAMDDWKVVLKAFPDMPQWPADAQMAFMCMSWWMGPFFSAGWPHLTDSLRDQDFFGAADNCLTKAHAPRDFDHQAWFKNAGRVRAAGLSESLLFGKDTPKVTSGVRTFDAASTVSYSKVTSADGKIFSVDGWYVQRMLAAKGLYKSVNDGLFGPVSQQALKDSKVFDIKTLRALSKSSGLFLGVIA